MSKYWRRGRDFDRRVAGADGCHGGVMVRTQPNVSSIGAGFHFPGLVAWSGSTGTETADLYRTPQKNPG